MKASLQSNVGSLVTADPFRCRVWKLSDRIEEYVTEESCRAEIGSMERNGQLVPLVGRPLPGHPEFDIEIICGARRLFVARHLKMPVRVDLREMTDREAAVAVEIENSLRKQTSPYERGMWLAKLLRERVYPSREEMARELRITPTQVTRLLKFADLPAVVIAAFPSPHDVLESWAVELHKAWRDERGRSLAERARALQGRVPRPPAVSVYETLLAARRAGPHTGARAPHRVVKSPTGRPLFRLEHQRRDVVLRIPNSLIDRVTEKEVTRAVVAALTRCAPGEIVAGGPAAA